MRWGSYLTDGTRLFRLERVAADFLTLEDCYTGLVARWRVQDMLAAKMRIVRQTQP